MSESIAEMVIPGTYIEVRAEGLIGVGGIVTGNIGIVGTAARGPVGAVRTLSSLADAIDLYGLEDDLGSPRVTAHPLSLVRTLRQAFEGGARNVLAVRAANGTAAPATLDIASADGTGFTLTATGSDGAGSSGTWGQDLTVKVVTDAASPDVCTLSVTYRKRSEVFVGADTEAVFNAITASTLVTASGLDHGAALLTPMTSTPLAGGSDGADAGVSDIAAALEILEEQPVNILLVAGMSAKRVGNVVQGHLARTLATAGSGSGAGRRRARDGHGCRHGDRGRGHARERPGRAGRSGAADRRGHPGARRTSRRLSPASCPRWRRT